MSPLRPGEDRMLALYVCSSNPTQLPPNPQKRQQSSPNLVLSLAPDSSGCLVSVKLLRSNNSCHESKRFILDGARDRPSFSRQLALRTKFRAHLRAQCT